MNNTNSRGILSNLQPPRGAPDVDRSFYTYGAPRGNSGPGVRVPPGLGGVRPANFASGGASGGSGMLARAAAAVPEDDSGGSPVPGGDGVLRALGGVRGAGTGRSDEIDAKLSDGEYVFDAETVALLGDGSTEAGVKRLDEMRRKLRAHKGKALAKGKFSPDARDPEEYLGLNKGGKVKKALKKMKQSEGERLYQIWREQTRDPDEPHWREEVFNEDGTYNVENLREMIEENIEGTREVDDLIESTGEEDPKAIQEAIRRRITGEK